MARSSAPLKFGLLLLPPRPGPDESEVRVDSSTITLVTTLRDIVSEPRKVTGWQNLVGSFRETGMSDRTRVVIVTHPTDRPNVIDGENNQLHGQLVPFIMALNLVSGGNRPWGIPLVLTGVAHAHDRLESLHQLVEYSRLRSPFYMRRQELVLSTLGTIDSWLADWLKVADQIRSAPIPPLLGLALEALNHAMSEAQLEFRIPELVRAAEAVLALRKGLGPHEFARRALLIGPDILCDRFLAGQDVHHLLRDVYELRSACVHGKLPFRELAARGAAGELRVAQLEYVAEEVARRAVLLALATRNHFVDRAELECAWDDGSYPPGNSSALHV